MRIKSCPVKIKAAGTQDGTDDGVFEAIVAAYNVDSVGDKIIPGAFADTLQEWKSSGDPIPVLWSHMSQDPDYHIGWVLDAEERDEGLWVKAQIDPEDLVDPASKAAKVYKLLKGRRVTQFSFAYDILEGAWVDKENESYYELRKLQLFEVGPTLIGANQTTELLAIKSADDDHEIVVRLEHASPGDVERVRRALTVDSGWIAGKQGAPAGAKAGKILSKANEERVTQIRDLAQELLDSVKSSDTDDPESTEDDEVDGENTSDDEKAAQARSAAPEEPASKQAKDDEPTQPSPASALLRADLLALAADLT